MGTKSGPVGLQSFDSETEFELAREETARAHLAAVQAIRDRVGSGRVAAPAPQFGLAVSTTVVELAVPDAANVAEIGVRTNTVVFTRTPGAEPTATQGLPANSSDIILLNSRAELLDFRVIRATADATLDVEFWTDLAL